MQEYSPVVQYSLTNVEENISKAPREERVSGLRKGTLYESYFPFCIVVLQSANHFHF